MNCVFEKSPDGFCRCVRGGCTNKVRNIADCSRIVAACKGGRPGLVQMAKNYGTAQVKDLAAGRPRRTELEILEIERICESNECGLYNAQGGWCEHGSCGCKISKKAPLALEVCPMGLWPKSGEPAKSPVATTR
jgi:hypothetical protein